jgi:hypothetical protein
MTQLGTDIGKKKLMEKDILVKMPHCPRGGILSAYLVRKSQDIVAILIAKIYFSAGGSRRAYRPGTQRTVTPALAMEGTYLWPSHAKLNREQ